MEYINLVSDTVTKPTKTMRAIMANAEVGDDVFREDPTVNELEAYVAALFGKESALYCASGTMTNQLAIKTHTQALDEMICDINSHVYQYETAGYAFHSSIAVQLIHGQDGKINAQDIENAVQADFDWLPNSRLVVLENSCNKAGGSYYTLDEIKPIADMCQKKNLVLHLDGARLFNVLVETGESTQDVGKYFDSISICTSKGLGAPVGSLLIGNHDFIKKARKLRKVFGGGMRQAGIIASASLYALKEHVERLKVDNDRAKEIGLWLQDLPYIGEVRPIRTNIIVFDLHNMKSDDFVRKLNQHGVLAKPISKETMRFVTHLDYTDTMHNRLQEVLLEIKQEYLESL